ncbi:hypothetical protein [Cohnella hashimotonis]|uniref:DUF1515 domain-containing protein n=1 Tax=Cohnella hashimotonis TaxID=2826895 RepID=A0ABT6TNS5_9BACL|nr:hypothetical protein [Cohnella hashimotonis]MDI4648512.1 hypothetical protein [Cohnella hashimotonis]
MINNLSVVVERLKVIQEHTVDALSKLSCSIDRLNERLDKSDDTAREADQRSKSAHRRLDDFSENIERMGWDIETKIVAIEDRVTKEISDFDELFKKQELKREHDRRWVLGTSLTSGALLVSVITLVLRTVGK